MKTSRRSKMGGLLRLVGPFAARRPGRRMGSRSNPPKSDIATVDPSEVLSDERVLRRGQRN
jgi:hypothetical protein